MLRGAMLFIQSSEERPLKGDDILVEAEVMKKI